MTSVALKHDGPHTPSPLELSVGGLVVVVSVGPGQGTVLNASILPSFALVAPCSLLFLGSWWWWRRP